MNGELPVEDVYFVAVGGVGAGDPDITDFGHRVEVGGTSTRESNPAVARRRERLARQDEKRAPKKTSSRRATPHTSTAALELQWITSPVLCRKVAASQRATGSGSAGGRCSGHGAGRPESFAAARVMATMERPRTPPTEGPKRLGVNQRSTGLPALAVRRIALRPVTPGGTGCHTAVGSR
jgi:hypothetical protein